jgi:hypothetical protein
LCAGRYKKSEKFLAEEHNIILRSQNRRLGEIGKIMHERAKNHFDPISHPVLLFERENLRQNEIDLGCLGAKMIQKRNIVIPDSNGLLKKSIFFF